MYLSRSLSCEQMPVSRNNEELHSPGNVKRWRMVLETLDPEITAAINASRAAYARKNARREEETTSRTDG